MEIYVVIPIEFHCLTLDRVFEIGCCAYSNPVAAGSAVARSLHGGNGVLVVKPYTVDPMEYFFYSNGSVYPKK